VEGKFSEVRHARPQVLHKNLFWEYVEVLHVKVERCTSLWEREGKRRTSVAALNIEHTAMGRAFWLRWELVNITRVVAGIALMFTGV
jgi:hypothetical protein